MATTKIWAIKTRLDVLVDYVSDTKKTENKKFDDLKDAINYAGNDVKTEQKLFVTVINCNPETAYKSMKAAHRKSTKQIKVLGYHAYQSFKSNEVTAAKAHEIGIKLATELWGDKFQVVVATHQNTGNIHNHFVFCATSFLDGKRFHSCKDSYKKMREVSDRLCRENSISVIDNPSPKRAMHYTETLAEKQGRMTWRGLIREDIDKAVFSSKTTAAFWQKMEEMGYTLKMNVKYPAVKPPGHERFFRLYKLGQGYTSEAIKKRILENERIISPIPERKKVKRYKLSNKFNKKVKIKGFRALYFYYCYKLGILPKKRSSNKRMHFLLKEDLLKMEKIIAQSKVLFKNKIDTFEQLEDYKEKISQQMQDLTSKRKEIKSELKREKVPEEREAKKSEILEISKTLRFLRKELKLCDDIKERSERMKEKIRAINDFEKVNRKEHKKYDEHSR